MQLLWQTNFDTRPRRIVVHNCGGVCNRM